MTVEDLIQKLILGEIKVSQGMMLAKVFYKDSLSEETYSWLCHELDHYDKPSILPEYRIINCTIKALIHIPFVGSKVETLDTSPFDRLMDKGNKPYGSPSKMLIMQSLESIEQVLEKGDGNVEMMLSVEQVDLLMKYYHYPSDCHIEKVYQECPFAYLNDILPSVRNKLISVLQTEVKRNNGSGPDKKKVFISYGWDNDAHISWVRRLAKKLSEHFDVIIDQKAPLGTDLNLFMEQMISEADRVLLILTPQYKNKADSRQNGVGYESVLISSELYKNQGSTKFIPILRKGTVKDSFPLYLGNRKGVIMTDDSVFEIKFRELVSDIQDHYDTL